MASDTPKDCDTLKSPAGIPILDVTNHSSYLCKPGDNSPVDQVRPGETGLIQDGDETLPMRRPPDSDRSWLSHTKHEDHASTPPIDVPRPRAPEGGDWATDKEHLKNQLPDTQQDGDWHWQEYLNNRRPSISFGTEVILDCGQRRALEEPLPRLAIKTQSDPTTRPRDSEETKPRFLFEQAAVYKESNLPVADSPHYNPNNYEESQHSHLPSSALGGVQSSESPARGNPGVEKAVSLTSEATASPIPEEPQTPPHNMEILASPISVFPPFAYPSSLEDSSAWPKPQRQVSASQSRSYNAERSMSMRQARRSGTRRSTSSSMSPATAFLSRFAREEKTPEPDSEGQDVGDYVLGKQVGFGGFSTVREAFTMEGDERICRAAKIVRRQLPGREEAENDRLQSEFEHEVQLWRCLGHRNILPLIEVYETNFATFCFTKLNSGGTLFDKIRVNRQGLSRDLARRYAYQLASAVRYLHEDAHVVHRDVKLENCLIDVSDPASGKDGGNLLLCDFGLAEFTANDLSGNTADPFARGTATASPPLSPSDAATSIAGSLQYASPELILSPAGFLSPVVDVWAFGVVVYAMLVGDLPFQHALQPKVRDLILEGKWNHEALERAQGVVGFEDETLELILGCLQMDSNKRWTIGQVLSSRWLRGMQEMLEEIGGSFKL